MSSFREMALWVIIMRQSLLFSIFTLAGIVVTTLIFGSDVLAKILDGATIVFWGQLTLRNGMKEYQDVKKKFPQHFQMQPIGIPPAE